MTRTGAAAPVAGKTAFLADFFLDGTRSSSTVPERCWYLPVRFSPPFPLVNHLPKWARLQYHFSAPAAPYSASGNGNMHMPSEPFRYAKLTSAAAARFSPRLFCAPPPPFSCLYCFRFSVLVCMCAPVLGPHIPRASFMERDVADSGRRFTSVHFRFRYRFMPRERKKNTKYCRESRDKFTSF